jgi:hypothetical protein
MNQRWVHSSGVVVIEEAYIEAMRYLQVEADAGRPGHAFGGAAEAIIPMWPQEQKYAKCQFCESCKAVFIMADDVLPQNDIPEIARCRNDPRGVQK